MLDKKLFKALRAGGLGHAAAALLAERSGQYAISKPVYHDHNTSYAGLSIAGYADGSTVDIDGQPNEVKLPPVPFQAGSSLNFQLYQTRNGVDEFKTAMALLFFTKVADANGIPVNPVSVGPLVATRDNSGVWTMPAVTGGWTVTKSNEYQINCAQATGGWYTARLQGVFG